MNKIISSKSAKIAAGVMGIIAGFAMITTSVSAYTFNTNLKVGSTGVDVLNLQKVLNMSADTKVDGTGAGSAGKETSYFGPATKSAVIRFQEKYASDILAPVGLTAGTGFVGASTRAHLNTTTGGSTTGMVTGCTSLVGFSPTTGQSCATGAVTTTIPAGCTSTVGFSSTTGASCGTGVVVAVSGPVSASLANDNPAASAVVAGQATADLMHISFTGNGTITNVKLQRTGISANSTLSNVYLYQGNVRVADGTAVNNTDGTITFNNLNIAVNGQTTISVKSDIAASTAGQVVGVALIGYTTSGNAMTSANISGNYMNVAGTTGMATVTLSGTQATSSSVNAGTIGYTLWSQSVAVTNRSVALKGATFKYIGSAPTDALANARLYVNGTAVGPVGTINSSNNLSFDFGSTPVILTTGSSIVEVRADIVKGSSRNIKLSLQNAADVMVMDTQLGINVALSSFSINDGGTMTINSGTITTTIDPAFNSVTNVTGGATGATIASFKLQAYGEDVKVSSLTVTPTFASAPTPAANGLNNVGLFYDGAQVGSSQNMVGTSTALTFQLGSALIVTAGSTGHILEVRADIQSAASLNYTAGTITVVLAVGSSNGQGMNSYTTSNVPASQITSTALTINTGALSVGKSAAYAASQTVNPNTANVKIGSYVIQNTSSSESVRITNLAVALSFATTTISNISNLRTSETSGSGSTPINPVASNNFSVNFTLAPGQTKTIDVMGDLGSDTSGTITSTLLPTAIGASSNVTLTPSSASAGQTLTLASGSLAVPTLVASGSLVAQYIVGNTSPATSQYKFVATNGTATISELRFAVGGTAGTSSVTQVSVGGQTAPVVNGVAQVTNLNIVVLPGASGTNVTVTPTFASVGTNGLASFTQATTSLTYMKYTVGGVTTATSTLAVVSNTMTLVGSKPTVTATQPSGVVLAVGNTEVIDITVSADSAGPITLNSLPIVATLNSTGGLFTAAAAVVKDANNNTVATTGSCTSAITCTVTIAFTGGREITSTPQTFKIFLPVSVVATTVASPNNAVNTTLTASSAAFSWTDTQGNNSTPITEAAPLIYNFPTLTSNIHN